MYLSSFDLFCHAFIEMSETGTSADKKVVSPAEQTSVEP